MLILQDNCFPANYKTVTEVNMSKNRIDKVNTELQRTISEIINNRLKDPRISGIISVLRVETAADLKHAKVYLSIFNKDKQKIAETFSCISGGAGFIRSELSQELRTHTIPQLHFINDDSMEHSQKINDIIEGLKHD